MRQSRHCCARGGGVVHWQPGSIVALESVQSASHRAGSRHQPNLADALSAVWSFRLIFLYEDGLDRWHPGRRNDVQRLQSHGNRHPAFNDELFGETMPEAHVHSALNLTLQEHRIDDFTNIMSSDDLGQPPVVVQNYDLSGPAVGEVRDWVVDVGARFAGPVDFNFTAELLAGQLNQVESGIGCQS